MRRDAPKSESYSASLLLFAIGLVVFFAITFTFSFRDKVFQAFFQKSSPFAQGVDDSPTVDLIAGVNNSFRRGVVNVENGVSGISLKWETRKAVRACLGRFWSNAKKEDQWTGEKDAKGGVYTIAGNLDTGIYVYSINCSNESGDSSGSSITINVGAGPSNLQPHITSFQVLGEDDRRYDLNQLNEVDKNTSLTIVWNSINTGTSYGVCVANGSWPTIYQDTGNSEIKETFTLDQGKIYKYSIFCSNENGYDAEEVSFIAR